MSELKKRLADLASQSYAKNIYTFSAFLSESELFEVAMQKFQTEKVEDGGCSFATRKMLRFGKDCYGSGDSPIEILKISPKSAKFAVEISHRDCLGAVMNLGIAREKIGDIFVSGKCGYLICEEKIAAYIKENLSKVAKNSVEISSCESVPEEFAPRTETVKISVSSPRLDSVIAKLYNLSREESLELFRSQKVARNAAIEENNSKILLGGEVISVRGYGKFRFICETGVSKKGKKYCEIAKFV